MSRIDFYEEKQANGYLSNYAKLDTPIVWNAKPYATSEHLYQARKFLYAGASPATRAYAELVRTQNTPNKARVLGQLKTGGGYKWRTEPNTPILDAQTAGVKIDPAWDDKKLDVMRSALLLKFECNKRLSDMLRATGGVQLSEHTKRDDFWGDGGEARNGSNHLGRLLMQVRSELQAAAAYPIGAERDDIADVAPARKKAKKTK